MYSLNGVDLRSSEYELLKKLVGCYDSNGDVSSVLQGRFSAEYADGKMDSVFESLVSKGLIEGEISHREIRLARFTQAGLDFVHDYEAFEKSEKAKIWSDRRFQIGLSIGTLVLSSIFGAIFGAITGSL